MKRDPFEAWGLKIITHCLIVAVLLGCHASRTNGVPQELLGVWGTSAPDYRGCSFEITARMIIFKNDVGFTNINWIKGTEKVTREGTVIYRIYYENSEALNFTASLVYAKTENGESLKFTNLNQVEWARISGPTI